MLAGQRAVQDLNRGWGFAQRSSCFCIVLGSRSSSSRTAAGTPLINLLTFLRERYDCLARSAAAATAGRHLCRAHWRAARQVWWACWLSVCRHRSSSSSSSSAQVEDSHLNAEAIAAAHRAWTCFTTEHWCSGVSTLQHECRRVRLRVDFESDGRRTYT